MSIRYSDFIDYSKLDPVKRLALELFEPTLSFPERLGIRVVPATLGEAAVAFDFSGISSPDWLLTSNIEGLGTKNRIADAMYLAAVKEKLQIANRFQAPALYRGLGQDTVAMSVNDQLSLGADVFCYSDMIACGDSNWFSEDAERTTQLLLGYRDAAEIGRFAIPQGETPELPDIIDRSSLDLTGASLGLIRPRKRLLTGESIRAGDLIIGLASSGPHANGLTKIRRIAERLPRGYFTPLGSGQTLGEASLSPTTLYGRAVIGMLDTAEVHYVQPITGHGWEKVARARVELTYVIERVPEPPVIFEHLIKWGRDVGFDVSNRENYYVWNMGVGLVLLVNATSGPRVLKLAQESGVQAFQLGYVDAGPRRVVMPFREKGRQVTYVP